MMLRPLARHAHLESIVGEEALEAAATCAGGAARQLVPVMLEPELYEDASAQHPSLQLRLEPESMSRVKFLLRPNLSELHSKRQAPHVTETDAASLPAVGTGGMLLEEGKGGQGRPRGGGEVGAACRIMVVAGGAGGVKAPCQIMIGAGKGCERRPSAERVTAERGGTSGEEGGSRPQTLGAHSCSEAD
eukprot:1971752-Rhodomonas_salina.3